MALHGALMPHASQGPAHCHASDVMHVIMDAFQSTKVLRQLPACPAGPLSHQCAPNSPQGAQLLLHTAQAATGTGQNIIWTLIEALAA